MSNRIDNLSKNQLINIKKSIQSKYRIKFMSNFLKAIKVYSLIKENDKIAIKVEIRLDIKPISEIIFISLTFFPVEKLSFLGHIFDQFIANYIFAFSGSHFCLIIERLPLLFLAIMMPFGHYLS